MQSSDDMIEMGGWQAIPLCRLHAHCGEQRDGGLFPSRRRLMDRPGPPAVHRQGESIFLRQ